MAEYVNGISCTVTEDASEVFIAFYQNLPVPVSDTERTVEHNLVSSIVMNRACASELCRILQELLQK